MKKLILVLSIYMATTITHAKEQELDSFCDSIVDWTPRKIVPAPDVYKNIKLAIPVSPEEVVKNLDHTNFIIVDNRSDIDRIIGKIPKTIWLTANPYQTEKNIFNFESVKNAINLFIKKRKRGTPKINKKEDLKKYKFVTFCNGYRCHRSTFAACELRRWGVPYNNIEIMLGGFPEWKSMKYPVR